MQEDKTKYRICRLCGCDTEEKLVLGLVERGGKSEESDVTFKPRAVIRLPICSDCVRKTKTQVILLTAVVVLFLLLFAVFGLFFAPWTEQTAPPTGNGLDVRVLGYMISFVALALIPIVLVFVFGENKFYSRCIHKAYDGLGSIPAQDVLYSPKKHIVKMSPARSIIAIDKPEMLARAQAGEKKGAAGKLRAMAMLGEWLDETSESACPQSRDFEHTWNGCRCSSCGKQRSTGHRFRIIQNKGVAVCAICGEEKRTD